MLKINTICSKEKQNEIFSNISPDLESLEICDNFASPMHTLPNFPKKLKELDLFGSGITVIPELPITLEKFSLDGNFTSIPALPLGLKVLCISSYKRINVSLDLPSSLEELYIWDMNIKNINFQLVLKY